MIQPESKDLKKGIIVNIINSNIELLSFRIYIEMWRIVESTQHLNFISGIQRRLKFGYSEKATKFEKKYST